MVTFGSLDPDRVPVVKMTIHGVQILIVFVIWCLEISVFVNGTASINGQNGWAFGAVRSRPFVFQPFSFSSSRGIRVVQTTSI